MKSKCGFCESNVWEVEEEMPRHSKFALLFVRCASCKKAVGVLEQDNVAALLRQLAKKLNIEVK
jgi:hypothetical protein